MEFKPHKYQEYCISRILDTDKVGLFLDMGLGKTVTTLTAIVKLKYEQFRVNKVLIIAPKKVAEGTWSQEKDKWEHTKFLRVSQVLGSARKRMMALDVAADLYIINRENVTWLVDLYRNKWPFDMVVVDESSSFKSPKAKRFKSLASVSGKIKHLVELTGTPSPNGLADLWSQVYLLDGGQRLGAKYTGFRERYFDPTMYGPQGYAIQFKAKQGSDKAILDAISDICVSMKAEDYLELPDVVYDYIPVVLDAKSQKLYNKMERDAILDLPDGELTATSAAALSNKLLQFANGACYNEFREVLPIHSCKLEALRELIEGLQGKPLLVFYNFIHDKNRILELLKSKFPNIKAVSELNPTTIEQWNKGEIDILLTHPASSAYGLNLQAGGNHVCWFGLTWNYEQYVQANARLHRQGQREKVIVHHLVAQTTRDQDVIKALSKKEDVQNEVMESLKARIKRVRKEAH